MADTNANENENSTNNNGADGANANENENQSNAGFTQEEFERLQEQNKKLFERAKSAEEKLKEAKKSGKTTEEMQEVIDTLHKTQLMAKGHTEAEIEIINRVAKETGVSPLEASQKKYVLAEIAEHREEERVKNATRSNNGGASGVKRDADYYIQKGELPDDPELLREVIAKKSGKQYKPLSK